MLENLKTVELRKLAGQMGIKGMSSARKEQLLPVIIEAIGAAHAEAITENAARAPKAKKQSKRCVSCGVRPIGRYARAEGLDHLCDPCCEESAHENRHSDDAHDAIANGADATEFTGGQETVDRIREDMKSCWICQPELNQASKDYVAKKGTSRAGMTFNVSIKASGAEKAKQVAEKLEAMGIKVSLTQSKDGSGAVSEIGNGIYFTWSASGRNIEHIAKGKNVRNVSEMLKKLAG